MDLIFTFGKKRSLDGCDIEFIKRPEWRQKDVIILLQNNETEQSSVQEQMRESKNLPHYSCCRKNKTKKETKL